VGTWSIRDRDATTTSLSSAREKATFARFRSRINSARALIAEGSLTVVEDIDFAPAAEPDATDVTAVRDALQRLRAEQRLTEADYQRLLDVLEGLS